MASHRLLAGARTSRCTAPTSPRMTVQATRSIMRRRVDSSSCSAFHYAPRRECRAPSRTRRRCMSSDAPGVPDKPVRGARATKVWAGRLSAPTSERVERYTSSLAVDTRLGPDDVAGSRAHARMLRSIGVLTSAQHRAIDAGLRTIAAELSSDAFTIAPGDEDIHTAVERR